ncbi:hypothetical protein V5F40_22810 [Xanthobacter sp. DSM 14520]|uniref:hypothetical protein n=1 Tax=Xanthobacter autotrophicus (strain ATCC BAA-1158 / Py2) TaxID=78245 RepID=UPI00372CB9F3
MEIHLHLDEEERDVVVQALRLLAAQAGDPARSSVAERLLEDLDDPRWWEPAAASEEGSSV